MFIFDEPIIDFAQNAPVSFLWWFFPIGYAATILIETPVLLALLPSKISFRQKLACGVWLTACTYPVVVLVLPAAMENFGRFWYLLVGELFAHFGECVIFWLAFRGRQDLNTKDWIRSFSAVLLANFASFVIGEILNAYRWFGLF